MSIGELVTLAHGFLGVLLIVGTPWAMAELLALSSPEGVKRLKLVTAGLAVIAFLVSIFLAAPSYLVYYPPAKEVILKSPTPWAHTVLMEIKEHVGLGGPLVLFVVAFLVWYYNNALIENKDLRKLLFALLAVSLVVAFYEIALGTYIARIAPVR